VGPGLPVLCCEVFRTPKGIAVRMLRMGGVNILSIPWNLSEKHAASPGCFKRCSSKRLRYLMAKPSFWWFRQKVGAWYHPPTAISIFLSSLLLVPFGKSSYLANLWVCTLRATKSCCSHLTRTTLLLAEITLQPQALPCLQDSWLPLRPEHAARNKVRLFFYIIPVIP